MNRLEYLKQQCGHGIQKAVADACGVTAVSAWRWFTQGHLPLTDLIGKTCYARTIEALTDGLVTEAQLHEDIRVMAGLQSTAA